MSLYEIEKLLSEIIFTKNWLSFFKTVKEFSFILLISSVSIPLVKKSNKKELSSLTQTLDKFIPKKDKIMNFKQSLKEINLKLWEIEDGKRKAEKDKDFGQNFIELARNVYKFNDERAKIKLEINNYTGSITARVIVHPYFLMN